MIKRTPIIDPEPFNPLDYADDRTELEVQRELYRKGIRNKPRPIKCPKCKGPLSLGGGYAGEDVLFCKKHGIIWDDAEGAIRNVL